MKQTTVLPTTNLAIKIRWVFAFLLMLLVCVAPITVFADSSQEDPEYPPIVINAINPGYTIDGKSNVGEFIELRKLSDSSISLADLYLRYTDSRGKRSNLYQFPEGSQMIGETLLLRLTSSPDASQADSTYKKSLAFGAGPLELVYLDTVISSVCWNGSETCLRKFSSGSPTSIVLDPTSGQFTHQTDYFPVFNSAHLGLFVPPATHPPDETPLSKCQGLQFSEILTYYESSKSEQFIELYNPTSHTIDLQGCALKYRNKTHYLFGKIQDLDYYTYYPNSFTLTKNPTSFNSIDLIDSTGSVVDSLIIQHGQKKAASLAQFEHDPNGKEQWLQTYRPTPESPNIYQQYRTCPPGRTLNYDTGNCVKVAALKIQKSCPTGQSRDPISGRCRKTKSAAIVKTCKPGYERNSASGRCHKIRQNTGAKYALEPELKVDRHIFAAVFAVAALVLLAVGYIVFQFRQEIFKFACRIFPRLAKVHRPKINFRPKFWPKK